MKARRRLALALLLLLLFVVGALLIVLLGPSADEPGDGFHDAGSASRTPAELSLGDRERQRVAVSRDTADEAAEPTTTVTTITSGPAPTGGARSGASPSEPPTTGPIRIRREEPSGTDGKGALRIRIDDGAAAARDDVRISVFASRDGTRGTVYSGLLGAQGMSADALDAGWASIVMHAGSLSRTTRVRVDAGLVTDVALTLPRGATITGEVRHREHGLLKGLSVSVGDLVQSRSVEGYFHDGFRGSTDAEGVFRLTGIPPGTYALTFKGGPLGYGLQPRREVTVTGSDDMRVDVLLGAVSMEGVIRDAASRSPVANAKVTVQSPHFATTTTDARGHYAFIDLVPGAHKVCVSAEGFGVVFVESGPVLADRATRFDVELESAVVVVLRLRDDEGAAVTTEVIVGFRPKEGTLGTGLTTNLRPDGDGHVRYEKVVVGSYAISVRDRHGGYDRTSVEAVLQPGVNEVDVVLPKSSAAEVKLLAEGTVTSAATGAPVAGAVVQGGGRAVTDSKGRFAIRGYGVRVSFVHIRCDGYGDERVEVPSDGPVEIALRSAAELVLRVRGKDGSPFAGRLVLGFTPRTERGTRLGVGVEADEHGTAVFRRVLPGRYGLTVGNDVTGRAEMEIEIQPGRNEIDVDLR